MGYDRIIGPPPLRPTMHIAPYRLRWCYHHNEKHWHIDALQRVAARFDCELCPGLADVVRENHLGAIEQLCWDHYWAMREIENHLGERALDNVGD